MDINRTAVCGTLESSDAFVQVAPGDGTVTVTVDSVVKRQFGDAIEASILDVCQRLNVGSADIYINDRGALDCTIRARIETALIRAGKEETT